MSLLDAFHYKKYKKTIKSLENRISDLSSDLDDAKLQLEQKNYLITQQREELNNLQKHYNDLQNFVNSHLPIFDTNTITDPSTFETMKDLWNNIVKTIPENFQYYSNLRQQRACDARLTPLDLCANTGSGHFRGIDEDYFVTLKHCDCMDFQRNAFPCKHMYRLAHELGISILDDVEYVPEPHKIMFRSNFIGIISPLLLYDERKDFFNQFHSSQIVVEERSFVEPILKTKLIQISSSKSYLLNYFTRDQLYSFLPEDVNIKKNLRKSELVEVILNNYPDVIKNIEKFTVPVELSPYVKHLAKYI